MFGLVDCNNFYVSCERVFNPSLNGKPVVVLSNNDGCIVSRSDEAKELGIKMGAPAFKMAGILQKNKVIVFSSNYALYGDISHRVMNTLGQFTPDLEVYSIDEAFLNLAGLPVDLNEYAQRIRRTVLKNIGMPVSIGIGPTKVLAKAANHFAKRVPENKGVCVLDSPDKISGALKRLEIDEVWGIGSQYAKFLKSMSVNTAWDFIQMQDNWVKKRMTTVGLRVKKELEGVSCLEMELVPPARKAICTSCSFGETLTEIEPVKEAVANYAARCGYKLRRQNSCAGMLMVFLHTSRFDKNEPQYEKNFVCRLPVPTNSSIELIKYALFTLQAVFQKGRRYKKAGVIVYDIISEDRRQCSLFDKVDRTKHSQIMHTLDAINAKFGRDTLRIAAQGSGKRQKWRLRREKLSPGYTTRWEDIIEVKV